MATQHYSLRWNNHQTHVLHAFDTLLQNETLVDVTLVCEETRVRAHKVVLSACSPFFQRIFSENPCKHPVIILKDLRRWEVQGIVDFMYKGEISVAQEHLTSLIKAAESLQVRGLAHTEEKEPVTTAQPVASQTPTIDNPPSFEAPPRSLTLVSQGSLGGGLRGEEASGEGAERGRSEGDVGACLPKVLSPFCPSPLAALEPPRLPSSLSQPPHPLNPHPQQPPPSLPLMQHSLSFEEGVREAHSPPPPPHPLLRPSHAHLAPTPMPAYPPTHAIAGQPSGNQDQQRSSPLPRRKQTDIPTEATSSGSWRNFYRPCDRWKHFRASSTSKRLRRNYSVSGSRSEARPRRRSGELVPQDLSKPGSQPSFETPENLSMKKSLVNTSPILSDKPTKCEADESQPQKQKSAQTEPTQFPTPQPPLIEGSTVDNQPLSMAQDRGDYSNCTDSISLPPLPSDSSLDSTPFPQLPSVSALSLTPPQAFNPDSQHIGFFSPMDTCQNPLLNEILPETRIENHILGKRKLGRPKGQHSAPRGGPPRSWTNSELTEALHNVWNKRMTTSQASRIFGIPYNSLLMYVRGKYGKSLKLEQLKKNCLVGGGRGGPLQGTELLPPVIPLGRGPYPGLVEGEEGGGSSRDVESTLPLDPYAQLYSDFGSFPIPVGMIHLLPQSEKNREFPVELGVPEKREKKKAGKRERRERREEKERKEEREKKEGCERAEKQARVGEEVTKEKELEGREEKAFKEAEEVVLKMKEDYQNREGVRGANLCDGDPLAEVVGRDNERRGDPMVCD